jgi:transcriptional regulator GlxA family with amidase domain
VIPTTTLEDCPERLTVLFVPGGTTRTIAAAECEKIRSFVRDRGGKAEWVTSVCMGSIVLGAGGLPRGYKATSHWIARGRLARFGAIPVAERVVIDRNCVMGAGVTSGLDFGLTLVEKLRDTECAQAVRLLSENEPQPPLDAGSEKKAPARVTEMLREMLGDFDARVDALAVEVARSKAVR